MHEYRGDKGVCGQMLKCSANLGIKLTDFLTYAVHRDMEGAAAAALQEVCEIGEEVADAEEDMLLEDIDAGGWPLRVLDAFASSARVHCMEWQRKQLHSSLYVDY